MKRREDGEEDDRPFSQRIFWWDEVPVQLQYNKFIRSGYRAGNFHAILEYRQVDQPNLPASGNFWKLLAGLSRQQCLCSMLQYHNETGKSAPSLFVSRVDSREAVNRGKGVIKEL